MLKRSQKTKKLHGSGMLVSVCDVLLSSHLNGSSVAENASWSTQTVKLQHPVRQGGRQGLDTSLISLPFFPFHHYPPMDTHMLNTVRHLHTTHTVLFSWDVIKLTGGGPRATEALYPRLKFPCRGGEMPQSSTRWFSESDHQRIWGLRRGSEWQAAMAGYCLSIEDLFTGFFPSLPSCLFHQNTTLSPQLKRARVLEKEYWRLPVVAFKAPLQNSTVSSLFISNLSYFYMCITTSWDWRVNKDEHISTQGKVFVAFRRRSERYEGFGRKHTYF